MNRNLNLEAIKAAVIFVALAFLLCGQTSVRAGNLRHKFHTSLTRMDYNAKEKQIEITIQLFPHDLVPLLEKRAGKKIELETTAGVDEMILDYLNENFIFKDKKGEVKKLIWVGKELEVDTAYIYLQISSDEGVEGAKLQNTIFFESFNEQTNLVLARSENRKADLLFVAGDKFKEISFIKSSTD
jgi:hypothetical protein